MNGGKFSLLELVPFAGALLTGAVGGCVASIQQARTKRETVAAFAVGYVITGAFGGLGALAALNIFYPILVNTWSHVFLVSGVGGVLTAGAIAAGNLSMRVVLRKLGCHRRVSERDKGRDKPE